MLVRRRLGIISELVTEYELEITVDLVRSADNKADGVTRVPRDWLRRFKSNEPVECHAGLIESSPPTLAEVKATHDFHHFGCDRSLYFARMKFPGTTRAQVQAVIRQCVECQSIDPAAISWEHGELDVPLVWDRLAVDVTHYGNQLYLSIIDCGPSRFAIWRRLSNEGAPVVCMELRNVFEERGAPREIMFDNALAFKSDLVKQLSLEWGVHRHYRCAHRPSGNGIVERHHRTIKRMAARSGKPINAMVYWYNNAPLRDDDTPAGMLYSYASTLPGLNPRLTPPTEVTSVRFVVGDVVFVKPAQHTRCTTQWPRGTVTGVTSNTQIEVDGTPRHVADLRLVPSHATARRPDVHVDDILRSIEVEMGERDDEPETHDEEPPRPSREHRLPERFADFEMDI